MTQAGLESAPIDVFDATLLTQITTKWQNLPLIVGTALAADIPLYIQTEHSMLLTRIVALAEAGRVELQGDPWDMHACRVRLMTRRHRKEASG